MKVTANYGSNDQKKLNQMFLGLLMPCAPVMMHCRAACSLSLLHTKDNQKEVFACFLHLLLCNNLLAKPLVSTEDFTVYLVYQEDMLLTKLKDQRASKLLEDCGYKAGNLAVLLRTLSKRMEAYFYEEAEFPHELGVFLGYPVEDVLAYRREDGRNPVLTGYWKVYHNVSKARSEFQRYDRAKEEIYQWYLKNQRLRF